MEGSDTLRDEVANLASKSEPLVKELQKIDALLREGNASVQGSKASLFAPFLFAAQRRRDRSDYGKLAALRSTLEESTDLLLEAGTTLRNLRETTEGMPMLWPLKGGIGHESMLFGYNPNPFTGIPYLHMGLDLGNYRSGDPVVASADGVVLAAYFDVYSGYGNNVIIGHEHGYYTRYAHLQSFSVRAKQKVRQGDVIGIVGETGRVDAPHLHYEIRLGPEILDPQPFIVYKTLPRRLGNTK